MIRFARRVIVFVFGMTVLLIGIAMIVLPGPAFVVIPIGLAILATEYAWARHWLSVLRESAEKGAKKLKIRSFFSRKEKEDEQNAASGK